MLLLPIKCPFASFLTPTQGIAGPSAPRDLAMFNLAIELGNRGITGPGNSHQSVGVAGLSNPRSPESESSHDGLESEPESLSNPKVIDMGQEPIVYTSTQARGYILHDMHYVI